MNPLKFWQSLLAVLWIFAFLGGGYFIYNSFFDEEPCPVRVQSGSKSCGASQADNIQQNNFSGYDVTSPLGASLLGRERLNLPR